MSVDGWIKWSKGLARKPEIANLADALGISCAEAAARCMLVWEWVDSNSTDGCNAPTVTLALLDTVSGVTGFAQAMQNVGWLEVRKTGLLFPHGDRHNGQTAKARALTARRVKRFRNASTVTSALPEKRREEKRRITPSIPPSGEVAADADSLLRLVSADTSDLLHDWLGAGRVSSHMLLNVAELIRDHSEPTVCEGIRICIENSKKTLSYLKAVVENGSQRVPKSDNFGEIPF